MIHAALCVCLALSVSLAEPCARSQLADGAELVDVRMIWDQAPHNAFTDLIRFRGRWFCVFREGAAHVSPDGALRVLTSADGAQWESAALIASRDSDLRDAKLTEAPGGRLMLCGAEALHAKRGRTHQSLAWFSDDGRAWSAKHEIGEPDNWLWRVTWHQGTAYGMGYACGAKRALHLYASKDGMTFAPLARNLVDTSYPNESSIVFDGAVAYCLVRNDGKPAISLLGAARTPYLTWEWKKLNVAIGGPHLIRLPDGRLVAAVRLMDKRVRTSLCWADPKAGTLKEFLALPSGGDTSYAGLVLHEGLLWVSYYSSHEGGKARIYLAKVKLPPASGAEAREPRGP